jgi:peptide/nickel transport system permease protein
VFFDKKAQKSLSFAVTAVELPQDYWSYVRRQFGKNRRALWSFYLVCGLALIAIFADVLANDKPLVCKLHHTWYFPVAKSYAVACGISQWQPEMQHLDWQHTAYEAAIFAPIPYASTTLEPANAFVSPFAAQSQPLRYRHWLGTDDLGRDVWACLIHGTRIAFMVGLVSMSVAFTIGVLLGAMAGFFSDNGLRISRIYAWTLPFFVFLAFFYGFFVRVYAITDAFAQGILPLLQQIFISIFIAALILSLGIWVLRPLRQHRFWGKKIALPLDLFITRLIEVVVSIPVLIFILAIIAITRPSIFNVMVIIGLINWTNIARFVRAELLRVRQLEYIEAATALGFGRLRTLVLHALPNALSPVFITVAFGIAGAILTESFLSFLNIGVPPEVATWGKMLAVARSSYTAWWMAVFPGMAIFMTVTLFNLIGEGLTDAIDPRLKQ